MKNGVWHNAKNEEYPPDGEIVLAVKENKAKRRSLCLATHWSFREWDDGWMTGGGCNNVIYWAAVPRIPDD